MEINPETLEIEIVNTEPIEGGIQVFARAWNNGVQIGFGPDGSVDIERFRIFNPPILVPDVNGDIIREWIDEKTGETKSRTLREDPTHAILETLLQTIKSIAKFSDTNIIPGKIGNTTSTFYPSLDGFARYLTPDTTFAGAIAANGNSSNSAAATLEFVRISTGASSTAFDLNARTFYVFDTSAIPDGDTISSATFSVYSYAKANEFTAVPDMTIAGATLASDAAIANSDYEGTASNTTKYTDTDISYASWVTAAYNNFALNATGIAAISKTGNTRIGGRNTADGFGGTTPTAAAGGREYQVDTYSVDQTGTSTDPTLVVEHAAAGATFIPYVSFIM